MLKKTSHPISLLAWIIGVAILVFAAFLYPKWTFEGSEAVLTWDAFGYYIYLPAVFIYSDLGGVGFLDELVAKYQPGSDYFAFPVDSGNYIMKYSMGQSIFYLPFFFLGHLWAKFSSYPADGFSYPYQFSIFWGSMFYAAAGLWLLRIILLKYFEDRAVAVGILLLVVATNYLNYVSFAGVMTHNHLFTLYAALLYFTISWHRNPTWLGAVVIGFLCGLAALTRPTEIICVLLPLLWSIYNKDTLAHKWLLIKEYKGHLLAAAVIAAMMGSLQIIYWKYYSGYWLVYSYEEQGFSFLQPHLIDGLFSFKKGWLLYTPIMAFAIAGLVVLYRGYRQLFWPVTIFSLLNLYIVFSWDIWWYGGSFGSRAMVQSYAIWMLPFVAFVQWALQRKVRWMPLLPLLAVFIWLNVFQTYHSHVTDGLMYPDGLTNKYWIKAFVFQERGKGLRQYLDLPFEAPDDNEFANMQELLRIAPAATTQEFDGKRVIISGIDYDTLIIAGRKMPANNTDDWVRATAKIYYTNMEWHEGKMARLGVRFYKGDKEKDYYTRLQWLCEPNTWYKVVAEMPLTYKRADADSIAVFIENKGQTLYTDTIKLEFLKARD